MKAERIALYAARFPHGFQGLARAVRVSREKLRGLPASYYPRAPRDGEHLIRVDVVDVNGVPHETGDVILSLSIKSASFPGLTGDWEIVQARPVFQRGSDDAPYTSRYLLVRPADADEAQQCRKAADEAGRRAIELAMNS